jgi:hypothetical protein
MNTYRNTPRHIPALALAILVLVSLACGETTPTSGPRVGTATPEAAETQAPSEQPTSTPSSPTAAPTSTPLPPTATPTNTPLPPTAAPTNTPLPPTAPPNPNLIQPGTYIVGTDIQPGIYRGQAGYDVFDSCYWTRLKDLSGDLDAVLANDNGIGQFYVEVRDSDYAFETDCELVFLSSLPEPPTEFPQKIMPGIYIVGVDIQPGTYRGQAGTEIMEACYWARLRNVSGELDSIIANDNATGQYYVQVQQSDFALSTACELERAGD